MIFSTLIRPPKKTEIYAPFSGHIIPLKHETIRVSKGVIQDGIGIVPNEETNILLIYNIINSIPLFIFKKGCVMSYRNPFINIMLEIGTDIVKIKEGDFQTLVNSAHK